MTLVFVNEGEVIALEYLVNRDAPEDLVLRLFQNDVTSGLTATQIEALTETDMTEADFTGYSAITLTGASWTAGSGDDPSDIGFAEQEFTSSADQTQQTIFGYYYTRATGAEMVAFEYFDASVTVEFENDVIRITPNITCADTQD
jgi:hypothetical protein